MPRNQTLVKLMTAKKQGSHSAEWLWAAEKQGLESDPPTVAPVEYREHMSRARIVEWRE